jgi:hypothetical protein
MKKLLLTLALAGGAMLGTQAATTTSAEAFGYCGWGGGCCARYYRPACTSCCGCRAYRVVRHYRRCCR